MNENIGKIIQERRKELKLSQRELAKKANINYNTIYNIENGKTKSSLTIYQKVCEVLGLKLSDIL